MNLRNLALAGASCWMALAMGCGADRQESTEVENEISVRMLSGYAMDSVALDSVPWAAWDSVGTLLATGATDSVGMFSARLASDPQGGILVEVRRGADTLRALAALDSTVVRSRVATVLVNSITQASVSKIGIKGPGKGFSALDVDAARSGGQALLDSTLGLRLPWKEVASDPQFRAFAPRRKATPTPLAGLLRAVDVRAAREKVPGSRWVLDLSVKPGGKLSQDTLFGRDLTTSLVDLRLPDKATTEFVVRLDQVGAQDGHWLDTWQKNQVLPDPDALSRRVPWTTQPEFQSIWLRLVQVTGDRAAALETRLTIEQRADVPPGRAREILALALAKLVVPDESILGKDAKPALDALLGQLVPQAGLMLEQMATQSWGPTPAIDGIDPAVELLGAALASQLPQAWKFPDLVGQPEPPRWVTQNYAPWKTPVDVRNGLKKLSDLNPQWAFPANPFP
ncbi:MAG TPA: hypothetical protein PKO15_03520 [Fibrobacteria bacterium]|nr:hypothetical protein [Fibrobacteria bacterium]HOX51166.1 hypothetical protein [Fibrobacteria bacterium]